MDKHMKFLTHQKAASAIQITCAECDYELRIDNMVIAPTYIAIEVEPCPCQMRIHGYQDIKKIQPDDGETVMIKFILPDTPEILSTNSFNGMIGTEVTAPAFRVMDLDGPHWEVWLSPCLFGNDEIQEKDILAWRNIDV